MQDYVKQESKYLSINGRALLDLTRGAPVILNPASEYGKELHADEVRRLLDGTARRYPHHSKASRLSHGAGGTAGQTVRHPSRNRNRLDDPGRSCRPAEKPHPLIGIEAASQNARPQYWPQLMQAIEAAAHDALPGLVFDVQRVDRYNPSGMTGALLQTEPFYRRAADPTLN